MRSGLACLAALGLFSVQAAIPLPEHPRPDFERSAWQNLNGEWKFRFDKGNEGVGGKWFNAADGDFPLTIQVPFPWGSKLSGVKDEADIAWYRKSVKVPETWKGKRVFLVVGASDWETTGWFAGQRIGLHQGGYTPFEFELTHLIKWGEEQPLTLRVDDAQRDFTLYGKQGYGNARGLWQTAYLEARSGSYIDTVHFIPDIDRQTVTAKVTLNGPAKEPLDFALLFKPEDHKAPAKGSFAVGQAELELTIPLEGMKLWDLDTPYLYEVKAQLTGKGADDTVSTYFGMRKVSVAKMPGTEIPYVALNNKPIYLQLTLDQSYHPDGYYTFPTDEFMKNEIQISKTLGLNGNRIHIKVEVPRKLYWADKLGLLIMADVPNSWGQPTQEMFRESEYALRHMMKRDMNHPCIFSWVLYNETWGLFTNLPGMKPDRRYLPETQEKVAAMYRLAKRLDPSRLVEDNSPCNMDHVVTDLFTWHGYHPGYRWESVVADAVKNTFPGSTWNCIGGYRQGNAPMFNSECGNVWGYAGSTGDVDWSWDYHLMMDAFRRHPQCTGWLYTEHHDVCNEWNGYVRFDRTEKITGIEELFPGMTLKDWHAAAYLALDKELFRVFKPGEMWQVPVTLSLTTDRFAGKELSLTAKIRSWDNQGRLTETPVAAGRTFKAASWQNGEIGPVAVTVPSVPSVGVVCFTLADGAQVIGRNFAPFVVRDGDAPRAETAGADRIVRVAPKAFTKAEWSQKQWNVFDGLKVNGAGKGYFEYAIPLPEGAKASDFAGAVFKAEISAKRLNGKDAGDGKLTEDMDYMRGAGLHDPSKNTNSYPMTDTVCWSGEVKILVNGELVKTVALADDPADHRGILSWGAQERKGRLNEAGSYGYLVEAEIPAAVLAKATDGKLTVRLETEKHGLALYGERFGRYPMDLTMIYRK